MAAYNLSKLTKMVGVRISEDGHRMLRVIAAEHGVTPGRMLDDLIRALWKEKEADRKRTEELNKETDHVD